MTYCIALRLDDGLVFLADTRTNAGVDNISTYRKLHAFRPQADRVFVLESAGNLASTQQVLDRIEQDMADPETESLSTVTHLSDAALYVGRLSREVVEQHRGALGNGGSSTFILGGQIAGERPDILLVYPEGNYIRASDDRPFLQIGETKYGKLMLELAVESRVDMDDALTIALSSMISAARANLSVGAPYDLALYRNGSLELREARIEPDDPILHELQDLWIRQLLDAVAELPHLRLDDLGAHRQ
jgi:putative proteasome-type protease